MSFTLWTGEEGFKVYKEVHQSFGNQVIHALLLPVITFAVLRWIYLTFRYIWFSRLVVSLIFLVYANFYVNVSYLDELVWASLTIPLIILAEKPPYQTNKRETAFCFGLALFIQEVVGHTLFEGRNSRLTFSHVVNAILYTPLFYTRGVWGTISLICGGPLTSHIVILRYISGIMTIYFGIYLTIQAVTKLKRKKST